MQSMRGVYCWLEALNVLGMYFMYLACTWFLQSTYATTHGTQGLKLIYVLQNGYFKTVEKKFYAGLKRGFKHRGVLLA